MQNHRKTCMNSKINIICRFGSCIVHSCHRDVLSTVELISLFPRSSTLLEHSLGCGRCHHRRHADSVVAHKGSFTIVNIYLLLQRVPIRGGGGGAEAS